MLKSSQTINIKRGRVMASLLSGVSLVTMLCVFVTIVVWVSYTLRTDIRAQLSSRDESVLGMLLSQEIKKAEAETLLFSFEVLPANQLWSALLEVAAADKVFAAQLYDTSGELLRSTSSGLKAVSVPQEVLDAAAKGEGWTEYEEVVPLSKIMDLGYREDQYIPVQTVYLPLNSGQGELLGVGRFLIDGAPLGTSFELLDERITKQAAVAGGVGSLLLLALFFVSWVSMYQAKQVVVRQAKRLRKANTELAMLLRTSALGSVAAHLVHGLRNPLAGVQQAVKAGGVGQEGSVRDADLVEIREASSRMQRLVDEVVSLLQGAEEGAVSFDLSVSEIASDMKAKFQEEECAGRVRFDWVSSGEGEMDSYRARVVMLVATNLIQNAIDASPVGGKVEVSFTGGEEGLALSVSDEGAGLKAEEMEQIFMPKISAKEGGAGIGLPISSQMAGFLKGSLSCRNREEKGAVFELFVPWES